MSAEAFDWLVLGLCIFIALGAGAVVVGIYEWWAERERDRRPLPPPEWRARVVRRWKVPE